MRRLQRLALTLALAAAGAAPATVAAKTGATVHGARAVERGHAVPAHAAAPPRPQRPRRAARHRPRPRDARALRRAKARAQRRYRRARGSTRRRSPGIRRRPAIFGGLSWQGISQATATPPDTTGAAGPSHYTEITNESVAVYSRSNAATLATAGLDTFLGAPGNEVTDPQLIWDDQTGRWYYAALDATSGSEALLFGWSRSADPTNLATGWCRFAIPTTGFLDDFPKLGDDDGHLIIGANRFDTGPPETFTGATVVAVDKPASGTTCPGAGPSFQRFTPTTSGAPAFTPVPANTTDAPSSGYVVAAEQSGSGGSHLEVWHLSGSSLVRDGTIAVTPYAVPANAPQASSPNLLDTSDARLTQAIARVDPATGSRAVWTQHTVDGPAGRSVVRWYELLPGQLVARQTGTVGEGADFAFNGAISPASDGASAMINYNTSGTASLPRVLARTRRGSSPPGQMSDPVELATSSSPYDDFSCSPCRWGDYAGAVPDPVDPSVVWGTNEYSAGATWTSRNFAIVAGGSLIASFSATPETLRPGELASFDASATTDTGGASIARYRWDLDGDGSFETDTGTDPHAARTYVLPGTLTVRLRVLGSNGDTSDAERVLTVTNQPPVAVLTASAKSVFLGRTVTLDGSRSFDPDGQVTRFEWDRNGDGTFETDTGTAAFSRSRAFKRPRTVMLAVRVTDERGATGQAAVRLTVRKDPRICRAARKRVLALQRRIKRRKRALRSSSGARHDRLVRLLRHDRRLLARAKVRRRRAC